jgi:hypothetical protein
MLIMDQKVTTQAILGELDDRGVKFATLRMRSPALMRHINALTSKDFKQITLDRTGRRGWRDDGDRQNGWRWKPPPSCPAAVVLTNSGTTTIKARY